MRRTRGTAGGWRERGAAAVELAIVFPLLLLIIAGIVDFGRFFLTEIQLSSAAREGARVAVLRQSDVESRAKAAAPGIPDMTFPTKGTCPAPTTPPPSPVPNVTIEVADPTFTWILLDPAMKMFGASGVLPKAEATAVMRCEV